MANSLQAHNRLGPLAALGLAQLGGGWSLKRLARSAICRSLGCCTRSLNAMFPLCGIQPDRGEVTRRAGGRGGLAVVPQTADKCP